MAAIALESTLVLTREARLTLGRLKVLLASERRGVTHREVYEQLLLCWREAERQLAGQLLGDRQARDEELDEETQDWREQWERADA